MNNNNNNQVPNARSSRASRKRARAGGDAAAPPRQGPAKRRRTARNRKRNAKRGRDASTRGSGGPSTEPSIVGFFAPVAEGTVMKSLQPEFTKTHNSERVVHREKIAKLVTPGTGVFTILAAIALQPGLAGSFPWLSNLAQGYESYRINRMRFTLVPAVGTATAGDIIMAPDYDAADPQPVGESAMSSYTDAQEANTWARFCCDMTPDYLNGDTRRKYVRLGALAANLDIKTYDSGNLFVASTDDAAVNTSKLWVDYDVTFYNPHVPPGGFFATGTLEGVTSTTAAAPFGTVAGQALTGTPICAANPTTGVITVTNLIIGQTYYGVMMCTGVAFTELQLALTTGLTAQSGPLQTFIDVSTNHAASWFTAIATASTATITPTVASTSVSSGRFVLTNIPGVSAFF